MQRDDVAEQPVVEQPVEAQVIDEQRLLALARAGDPDALGSLIDAQTARVRGVLAQTLGARAALDDLVQEVKLKAVRGFQSFRGDARFSTWLHRIAVNAAISEMRRRRREEALPDELPGRHAGPSVMAERTELRERLAKAVSDLPPLMAEAFELKYRRGLDSQQIGRQLQVPAATVRTRIFHARRRLREALDEHLSG